MFRANLAIAAAAALLTAVGLGAPANATLLHPDTALSSVDNCSDGPTFVCDAGPTGGTPPYTVTFTAVTNATITHYFARSVVGTCTLGSISEVDITVTDAAGGHFFDPWRWRCQRD